jgi:hypothetical protein
MRSRGNRRSGETSERTPKKFRTFEVVTSPGRRQRFGAALPEGAVDMNFACAWHLACKGEVRLSTLADVLVPGSMIEFIRGGDTSMGLAHAARIARTMHRTIE